MRDIQGLVSLIIYQNVDSMKILSDNHPYHIKIIGAKFCA